MKRARESEDQEKGVCWAWSRRSGEACVAGVESKKDEVRGVRELWLLL